MNEMVLFVDDEEHVLNSVERLFAESDMGILRAGNAREAMSFFNREEIAVVVSDNMMPGTKGLDFLAGLKTVSPYTVKILMTAYADLATALEAINSGEVYRFIMKPWENEALVVTVEQALNRYRSLKALRREDETILHSLAQTIELKDPYTKGHCARVATYALMIADILDLPKTLRKDIRYGSWLHDCGKIGVPEAILNFAGPISSGEFETMKKHPEWGAEVARQARLSEAVVNIILHHHERYDGQGYPAGLAGDDIPFEARIVTVADIYDALTSERPYRHACSWREASETMASMTGSILDPQLVDLFFHGLKRSEILPNDSKRGGVIHG